ncbi:MAG TPA: hypothetical protein VGI40_20335 [Pirellulaceae bacterium]
MLLVISLLALFVLLGVSFSLIALQSLNASKLDLKINQVGDGPDTEMDIVLGQLLYDTQSRTVLQYHSLLRDLYGYDANNIVFTGANGPQQRESFQGMLVNPTTQQPFGVTFPTTGVYSGGGQFYTFNFAIGPYPITSITTPPTFPNGSAAPIVDTNGNLLPSLTALSQISNYYAGRVITFTSGIAANHSARIVAYNPIAGFTQHLLNASAKFTDNSTSTYYPAYGQITIEAIESKLAGSLTPSVGDSFVVNGAPFNGAGAGFDPITANIDQVLVPKGAIQAAIAGGKPLSDSSILPSLNEYVALLPNYASYDANLTAVAFDFNTNFDTTTLTNPEYVNGNVSTPDVRNNNYPFGNKARPSNTVGLGGFDESWDAPDFQNMFLAMVPPKAAINQYPLSSSTLPIIPSFHRPELINYWVNYIMQLLANAGIVTNPTSPTANDTQMMLSILAYPLGPDGQPNTADDPVPGQAALLMRIYNIMHGCIMRPMPWDHPKFTGSNPYTPTLTGQFDTTNQFTLLANIINAPVLANPITTSPPFIPTANSPIWDVDNDSDGVPDSVWIDPGLPVITSPDGRRYKRLAAILVKDMDGLINVNAHGNLQQTAIVNGTYPYLARSGLAPNMIDNNSNTYQTLPVPSGSTYSYGYGLGVIVSGGAVQHFPRGIGFGPAEVEFSNLLGNDLGAYSNLLFSRYVSQRQTFPLMFPNGSKYTASPVPDTLFIDDINNGIAKTGLPFARPGLPYYRDALSVVKHNGVPTDYSNNIGVAFPALQPSWYASPPDVWGRGAVLLDVGGQPLMAFMGQANEMFDSPYEMCLSGEENGADSPYTVAELEVLYRYHDADASQLARRLLNAARYSPLQGNNYLVATNGQNSIDFSHARRNSLTTLSSHIPAPAMRPPQEVRVNTNLNGYLPMGSTSILDLYRAKIGSANTGYTPTALNNAVQQVAPWEFFKGQKLDLNRWLGDGVDNDRDGYRDDISESYVSTVNLGVNPPQTTELAFRGDDLLANGTQTDNNGDGNIDVPNMSLPKNFVGFSPAYTNGFALYSDVAGNQYTVRTSYAAKQLYARHLFCLAMLLLPDDMTSGSVYRFQPTIAYDTDASNATLYPTASRQLMVRRIAQWAINCVDFRDPDSAMTPFEFDYSPFTDDDGNPANGTWDVDGYVGTNPGPDGAWGTGDDITTSPDDTGAFRGLVWGLEAPDLLISETLAFHDRGLKDTNQDNNSSGQGGTFVDPSKNSPMSLTPDQTLDQFRMPKGSAFIELYSPRATAWPGEPTSYKTPSGGLNLAYTSPADGSPLWRLAFSKLNGTAAISDPNNPAVLAVGTAANTQYPETVQPELVVNTGSGWSAKMSLLDTSKALAVDRFAYFVNSTLSSDANNSFVNTNISVGGTLSLFPGQYAVVGPRALTYLGSQNPSGATPTPPAGSLWGGNSNQYIQLNPNNNITSQFASPGSESLVITNTSGTTTSRSATSSNTDMRQPLAIVCDMNNPLVSFRQGLNVSEPLALGAIPFPAPTSPAGAGMTPGLPSNGATNLAANAYATPGGRVTYPDFYDDPDVPTKKFLDVPLEDSTTPNYPIYTTAGVDMRKAGTYADCSTVLLQRLADATLPYNPPSPDPAYNVAYPVNPYVTVDWASLDLHVISGEEDPTNNVYSSQSIYYPGGVAPQYYFRSRQRGFLAYNSTYSLTSNPWPPLTLNGSSPAGGGWVTSLITHTTPTYFGLNLANNSKSVSPAIGTGATPTPFSPFPYTYNYTYNLDGISYDAQTLGSLNSTIDYPVVNNQLGSATNYYGEPFVPFPWLAWNNRPFSNAMELLNVPASAPGRLALEMTPDYPILPNNSISSPQTIINPYGDTILPAPTAPIPYRSHWPFGHLLNFFQTAQINAPYNFVAPNNAQTQALAAPHFYRLLDFVEVPSPFAGAERWYNPTYFAASSTPPITAYEAPFNKLSRFRDPGRINLNTIYDNPIDTLSGDGIWDAAISQFPGLRSTDPIATVAGLGFYANMAVSRQGDGNTFGVYGINPSFPTRFANPFRSADSSDLMPPGRDLDLSDAQSFSRPSRFVAG